MPRPASAAVGGGAKRTPTPSQTGRPGSTPQQSRVRSASKTVSSITGKPTTAKLVVSEAEFLQEQLHDVLRRQAEVDEEHQRGLLAYRHSLRRLYNENAVLRNIITAGERRSREGGESRPHASATVTDAEIEHLDLRRHLAVRRRNRLVNEVDTTMKAIMADQSGETDMQASLNAAQSELLANRPLYLRVQRLERRLNEVLRQQGMLGVVSKGYQHHLSVLRDECKSYDVWMRSLEFTLSNRHRDHVQLATLYKNAQSEFQSTANARGSFEASMTRVRRAKERALLDKRQSVEKALRETHKQERRIVGLQQQLEEEAQLLEAAENVRERVERDRHNSRSLDALLRGGDGANDATGIGSALLTGSGGGATTQEEERLLAYQKAFRTMMTTARVDTPEDLVRVFEEEFRSEEALAEQVATQRVSCEALRQEVRSLRARAADARSCGIGRQRTITTALEEELHAFLREEVAELTATTNANRENEALLTEVVRRVNELAERLAEYRPDVAIPTIHSATAAGFPVHLAVLTQKILALADDATRRQMGSHSGGVDGHVAGSSATGGVVRSTQLVIPENNVRVQLRRKDHEKGGGGGEHVTSMASSVARAILQRRQRRRPSVNSDSGGSSWVSFHTDLKSKLSAEGGGATAAGGGSSGDEDDEEGEHGDSDGALSADDASEAGGTVRRTAVDRRGAANSGRLGKSKSDDPLKREEVKRMSEVIQAREQRRIEKEERRRSRGM